ncbi:MAG TPA: hypothetical protein VF310_03875 [Vicinamibacteria bacterium]
MEDRNDRRQPNRSAIRQHLMKRLAVLALSLAVGLVLGPLLLVELGWLGPTPQERVGAAERALGVARAYGAPADDAAVRAAEQELAAARRLVAEGRRREARAAAGRAQQQAVAAQREALVRRDESRRQAQMVVDDLDRRINDLEELYEAVTPGLPKPEVSRLFSRMKRAREASGTIFLAFEEKQYDRVIAGHAAARQVLEETAGEVKAARR